MTESPAAVPDASVVVVTIDHRHGTTVHAHRTAAGAQATLLDHARTWWHELAPDPGPVPTDPNETIAAYFARHPEDFHTIDTVELHD